MTEPMIQRVIQAIADNMPSPYAADIYWHPLPEGGVRFDIQKAAEDDQWQKVARAVIEAMRVPSVAMGNSGAAQVDSDRFYSSTAGIVWQSMIDAALKEGP